VKRQAGSLIDGAALGVWMRVPKIHLRWSQRCANRPFVLGRRSQEVLGGVTTRTIQVDRALPEIHRAVTAALVNPQFRGPDEFRHPHAAPLR
jgi:hypothetical protein